MSIRWASSGDQEVRARLASHPHIEEVRQGSGSGIQFFTNRVREVLVGDPSLEVAGLSELMDNNPMVCADVISVPDPASTLALIALGPLASAGLIVEAPVLRLSCEADEAHVDAFLAREGWEGGLTLHAEPTDLDGVVAATAIVAISTPSSVDEIDELFAERFSRSFYVRRDETSEWHVQLVKGQPYALYRLRIGPDEPYSLLTIQVMADLAGKAGSAQVVHAMNLMAGEEESLGIS